MLNTQKPVLDYIESEIAEFCNLNCRGCSDFSNLAEKKEFYELEEFRKDYLRLSQLFSGVEKIRLMGGEPLLNERLDEYVLVCREIFPQADIRIVSNGLLIPKLTDDVLEVIRDNGVKFDISNYPPTRKMLSRIKERLEQFSIEYDLGFPMDFFFRTILEYPSNDPVPAFNNCIFTHCHMLGHGKLSPCSYAHCIGSISGQEILDWFNHPHDFCKCCGRGAIPFRWQPGVKNNQANKYDWLIREGFFNTKVAPVLQTVIKKPAQWLRALIQNKL